MTPTPSVRVVMRGAAIAIALVAAADPAITSSRTVRPDVALATSGSARDSAFSDRVARALSKDFTVVRAPLAAAAATVIVGERLPTPSTELASPAFAVFDDANNATVSLDAVRAPSTAPPNARVPIAISARVNGARGRTLDVTLRANGLVVDRVTKTITTDDEHTSATLTFVPTASGATPLRVQAMVSGGKDSAMTDIVVEVRQTRIPILFFDPRPSWMSTFVRRAIERDPRFVLTSRVVTSRNLSTDAGRPPDRLGDATALAAFDAVVVGAPDALVESDVAGLDGYMRRRGGGVILLFDQRASGPYERLTNSGAWAVSTDSAVVRIGTTADTAALRASEVMWPLRLPTNAHVIARTSVNPKHGASDVAAVWRTSVGAGRLIANGALDAWRFRDRSGFDGFWRALIAETGESSPPAVAVQLNDATARPGEQIDVRAIIRDAALQESNAGRPVQISVTGSLTSSDATTEPATFRLWPSDGVGALRGVVRAPDKPGVYQVMVSADGMAATTPLVVIANASHPTPDDRDLVAAWTASRGGRALPRPRLGDLPAELRRVIRPTPRRATWYPMRSEWWIVPFALLLSAEWWLRRRSGLA